jgi:hypothetical protein
MEPITDVILDQNLRDKIVGKTLTHLELFIISDNFFVFEEEKRYVVDAGIGLLIGDVKFIFAWDTEKELFCLSHESMKSLLGEKEYFRLNDDEILGLRELIGSTVKDVHCKWNFYQQYDEEGNLLEEKTFIPIEIQLEFDNDRLMHIAAVEFAISAKDHSIMNARYNSQGNLYVGLDQLMSIS